MLCARLVVAILAAVGAMAVLPGSTLANGGAFLEFGRRYVVPGEAISGQTTFSSDVESSGRIEDGPYYAYLLPSDRWIHPPEIPGQALPLGPITITDPGGSLSSARISFVVPNTAPGDYTLSFCNQPCRHATVGDLAGGWLSVVPTKEEALRREISDQFKSRLSQVRGNLAARIRRAEKAQRDFTPRTEVRRLTERVTRLETRLAGMQREQARLAPGAQRTPWIVTTIAVLIAGGLWFRRLRRQRSTTVGARRSDVRLQGKPKVSADADDFPGVDDQSARELDPAKV